MAGVEIVSGYLTGMIGDMTRLNALYYSRYWKMELEAPIAKSLGEFFLRYDPQGDGVWTVSEAGQVVASIILDGIEGETTGAHIRFFIVADSLQGQGIGRRMMQIAMDFCHEKKYKRVYLKTFEGLEAACHLYESFGFVCYDEMWDSQHKVKDLFYECYLTE